MTDQTPGLLERLDQTTLAPAPLDDIVHGGRALRARRRRRLMIGTLAAVLLVTGGGAVATRALTGPDASGDRPQPGGTGPGVLGEERLPTRIVSWTRLEDGHWPTESSDFQATYVPETGMLLYRSRDAYSTACRPFGAATVDPAGNLSLTISQAAYADCTARASIVVAVVRGVPALRSLTVTEPDGTQEASVMQRVPDVAGASIASARATLEDAGLTVHVVRGGCARQVGCRGSVVRTVPAVDTAVPIRSAVTLVARSPS